MTSVDADHAMRVIRARCGDMLAPSDLALVERALNGGEAVPGEVLERIGDFLDALDERLAATVFAARSNGGSRMIDNDIPVAFLAECFTLDAETPSGLRWRERPLEHFASSGAWATWNARFAGTEAGTPDDKGYLMVRLTVAGRQRSLKAHRIVFALAHGRWPRPGYEIDHENSVEAGNGFDNLREATHGQNQHNQRLHRNNASGFPGVS